MPRRYQTRNSANGPSRWAFERSSNSRRMRHQEHSDWSTQTENTCCRPKHPDKAVPAIRAFSGGNEPNSKKQSPGQKRGRQTPAKTAGQKRLLTGGWKLPRILIVAGAMSRQGFFGKFTANCDYAANLATAEQPDRHNLPQGRPCRRRQSFRNRNNSHFWQNFSRPAGR